MSSLVTPTRASQTAVSSLLALAAVSVAAAAAAAACLAAAALPERGPGPEPEPEPEPEPDDTVGSRRLLWKVAHPDGYTVNVRRGPGMADRGPDSDSGGVGGSVHVAVDDTEEWVQIGEGRWLPKVWLVPSTEAELAAFLQVEAQLSELEGSTPPRVVAVMNGGGTHEAVQGQGCDRLSQLSMSGQGDAVAAALGVEAIVNAMQAYEGSLGVQQSGALCPKHAMRAYLAT
jgi:hypothetical protein